MKVINKSVILLIAVAFALTQQSLSTENIYGLYEPIKGGFKKCESYSYSYKFGDIDHNSEKRIRIEKYDQRGNKVEYIHYNSDGNFFSKSIYKNKYDIDGKIIEINEYDPEGTISSKTIYKYDSNGNMIEGTPYYNDFKLGDKRKYKFDSNGNKVERKVYNPENEMTASSIYKYNQDNILIEELEDLIDVYLMSEIGKYTKNLYKYDIHGNLIESIKYNTLDEPEVLTKHVYSN